MATPEMHCGNCTGQRQTVCDILFDDELFLLDRTVRSSMEAAAAVDRASDILTDEDRNRSTSRLLESQGELVERRLKFLAEDLGSIGCELSQDEIRQKLMMEIGEY